MNESDSGWTRKGATLSDKTARKEFGLTQEEIVEAIREGKMQFRENHIHGNPYLRLLRHEVETLVSNKSGQDHLHKKKLQKELADIKDILTKGRIVIIPFLHGKLTADAKLVEPNIEAIFEAWLERHPQFRGSERGYRIISAKTSLREGTATDLVRVTAEFTADLADYDPAEDADLYDEFLAEDDGSPSTEQYKIWIEQCEATERIEDDFGTQKALAYLVGEKFLNFLEAAESDADFRAEIPAFVAKIKTIFERWQLEQYLETAQETEPFDLRLFEGDAEFDAEEVEDMRKDDIRQCTRDLLLVERAREWLLEQ